VRRDENVGAGQVVALTDSVSGLERDNRCARRGGEAEKGE